MDVSVIVVSYNARELLDDCVQSVLERPEDGLDVEIIVVDNASADGSAAYLRGAWPQVRVIESGANRGFAAGNNLGIAAARGRHLLLLNSDARLLGDALATMVAFLDAHPDVGQVGPLLRNADLTLQRSARGFPTVWRLATEYLYLRKLGRRTRLLNEFYKGWFAHDHVADMDFLMGACLLVRRAAVDEVGLMDEGYFMFSEETDWARRFREAGWRVTFVPDAAVVHLGGASTAKEWDRMYASQVAGHLRYLALHESPGTARRAQQLLTTSLRGRAALYRALARVPGGSPEARVARAGTFTAARRAVAAVDPEAFVPEVPAVDGLRRDGAPAVAPR